MRWKLDDLVEVYDPDERKWYAGHINAIQTFGAMPEQFYVVALDEKHPLTEQSFTTSITPEGRRELEEGTLPRLAVLAVPVSHEGWIRTRSDA